VFFISKQYDFYVPTPITCRHWFVLLKYDHKLLYIIIEILAEILFEWTVFSTLESMHQLHWTAGVMLGAMLFAHWCYFGAGAIALVFSREKAIPTNSDNLNSIKRMTSLVLDPKEIQKRMEIEGEESNDTFEFEA
jgi:hypothetical protein